jgi:hypothetical protein
VPVGRRHEPLDVDFASAGVPPANDAHLPLHFRERGIDRALVRLGKLRRDIRARDGERDADGLRRREREVERRD